MWRMSARTKSRGVPGKILGCEDSQLEGALVISVHRAEGRDGEKGNRDAKGRANSHVQDVYVLRSQALDER